MVIVFVDSFRFAKTLQQWVNTHFFESQGRGVNWRERHLYWAIVVWHRQKRVAAFWWGCMCRLWDLVDGGAWHLWPWDGLRGQRSGSIGERFATLGSCGGLRHNKRASRPQRTDPPHQHSHPHVDVGDDSISALPSSAQEWGIPKFQCVSFRKWCQSGNIVLIVVKQWLYVQLCNINGCVTSSWIVRLWLILRARPPRLINLHKIKAHIDPTTVVDPVDKW